MFYSMNANLNWLPYKKCKESCPEIMAWGSPSVKRNAEMIQAAWGNKSSSFSLTQLAFKGDELTANHKD